MFVYEKMSKSIKTVLDTASVSKAFHTLLESDFSNLPVVDKNNKLQGIISKTLIEQVNPKKSTSLTEYEINFLLNQTKVSEIMQTGVFKINQNKFIEDASLIMKENKLSFLPVIDDENNVVGVITMFDIFKGFIDILNIEFDGNTICLSSKNQKTDILEISNIVLNNNGRVIYFSNYINLNKNFILLKTDLLNINNLLNSLISNGYEILYTYKQN